MKNSTIVHTSAIHNTSGAPFSYGMLGFDTCLNLNYSTLHTICLGEKSSNYPLQRSFTGTFAPFNAIPYNGGHIPPPSPSLGGAFQQPSKINTNSKLFSGGIYGPQSYMNPVGSIPFSLFVSFGKNVFFSSTFSLEGNPLFNKLL